MNTKMFKGVKITPKQIFIALIAIFFIFLFINNREDVFNSGEVLGTAYSDDYLYRIDVEFVDYGGTYSPCSSFDCGGEQLVASLKRNSQFSFLLPKKNINLSGDEGVLYIPIPCSTWNIRCDRPLERFKIQDGYLIWYGTKLKI